MAPDVPAGLDPPTTLAAAVQRPTSKVEDGLSGRDSLVRRRGDCDRPASASKAARHKSREHFLEARERGGVSTAIPGSHGRQRRMPPLDASLKGGGSNYRRARPGRAAACNLASGHRAAK